MNNLYFDEKKLNFSLEEIPLCPILEQYEYPSFVRNEVYSLYRGMESFGLLIKEIKIISFIGNIATISITSNSVMNRYNLTTEIVKLSIGINF